MKLAPGQRALVTGGSRGLGLEIARALAAKGVSLALAARSAAALEAAAEELRAGGASVTVHACDLTQLDRLPDLLCSVEQSGPPIDLLVNNAGAEQARSYPERETDDVVRDMTLNLIAPMALTRLVLPSLIARCHGHILNVASVAGLIAMPYQEPYVASKFGLVGFSRSLRLSSAAEQWGVGVSVLCPGFVDGDGMFARIAAGLGLDPAQLGAVRLAMVGDAAVDVIEQDRELAIVSSPGIREAWIQTSADLDGSFAGMLHSPVTALFGELAKM